MKTTTTVFATSFLLAVTAGWAYLDAGSDADGPAQKPALHEVTIAGAKLTVALDRERVPAGESVKVTLAMIDTDRQHEAGVELHVSVLEQGGSMMSRSMPPAVEVLSTDVRVGSKDVVLPIKLAGGRGVRAAAKDSKEDPLATAGMATQYTIVITAKQPAEGDGELALPAFAYRPEAYQLTVDPPGPGKAGEEVALTVRVKSLATKPLKGITVGVSSSFLTIDDSPRIETLAAGEEVVVRLKGTRVAPAEAAPLLIQAFGWAEYGGSAAAWATVDAETGKLADRASAPLESAGLAMLAYVY